MAKLAMLYVELAVIKARIAWTDVQIAFYS